MLFLAVYTKEWLQQQVRVAVTILYSLIYSFLIVRKEMCFVMLDMSPEILDMRSTVTDMTQESRPKT